MIMFFKSSSESDNCNILTILANNALDAVTMAKQYFIRHGYKGKPTVLAI